MEKLKTVLPLVQHAGAKIDYSPTARAAALSTLYALTQFHGCPSVFLTIAPDDVHNVLSIRMSFPTTSGNGGFPAIGDTLLDHLCKGEKVLKVADIPLGESDLKKFIVSNPVAAASTLPQKGAKIDRGGDLSHRSRVSGVQHGCNFLGRT